MWAVDDTNWKVYVMEPTSDINAVDPVREMYWAAGSFSNAPFICRRIVKGVEELLSRPHWVNSDLLRT